MAVGAEVKGVVLLESAVPGTCTCRTWVWEGVAAVHGPSKVVVKLLVQCFDIGSKARRSGHFCALPIWLIFPAKVASVVSLDACLRIPVVPG